MSISDENRTTWKLVQGYAREYPDHEHWNRWRGTISPLMERAIECEVDSLFRAGLSMSTLILSTLDHHGLRAEPRVSINVTQDWALRISYSTWNVEFKEPAQFEVALPSLAFPIFTRYLRRLWEETMPEPIPEILRRKENYRPQPDK